MVLPSNERLFAAAFLPVVAIVIGGAGLSYLERPHEMETAIEFEALRKKYHDMKSVYDNRDNHAKDFLDEYISTIKLYIQKNLDNDVGDIRNPEWHFSASALFCLTLMSTIGYGVYTPNTTAGKCFCCLFTVATVPLFYYSIQSFGVAFHHYLDLFSWKLCKLCGCYTCCHHHFRKVVWCTRRNLATLGFGLALLIVVGATFDYNHLRQSPIDSLYFNTITMATVGLGDFAPDVNQSSVLNQIAYFFYIEMGLSLLVAVHQVVARSVWRCRAWLASAASSGPARRRPLPARSVATKAALLRGGGGGGGGGGGPAEASWSTAGDRLLHFLLQCTVPLPPAIPAAAAAAPSGAAGSAYYDDGEHSSSSEEENEEGSPGEEEAGFVNGQGGRSSGWGVGGSKVVAAAGVEEPTEESQLLFEFPSYHGSTHGEQQRTPQNGDAQQPRRRGL